VGGWAGGAVGKRKEKKEKSQRKGKWPISGSFGGRFIFTIPF
jgi:hypothetical protein